MYLSEAYTITETLYRGTSFNQQIYTTYEQAVTELSNLQRMSIQNNLEWSLEVVSLEEMYEARWEEGYAEGRTDERMGH